MDAGESRTSFVIEFNSINEIEHSNWLHPPFTNEEYRFFSYFHISFIMMMIFSFFVGLDEISMWNELKVIDRDARRLISTRSDPQIGRRMDEHQHFIRHSKNCQLANASGSRQVALLN